MATYQDHLSGYFKGDKQAYANAIKSGAAAGTLSDPTAAAAFKQANPNYFTAAPSTSSSGSGGVTNDSYFSNPLWVGNMFPGATFDATTRSIAAPGAGTLKEGTDFSITGDRAYVNPSSNILGLMALTQYNKQQQTPPPPMPNINLQYPTVNSMSYDQAYTQAGKKIDPLTQLSEMQRNRMAQEQRERLPYLLNARGQLYGGLRQGGDVQIDQDTARALDELRLMAESQKAEAAQGIFSGDQARAERAAQSMYQQQSDQANLAMRQWEQGIANDRTSKQDTINTLMTLSGIAARNEEAKRASSQDALQANQWNMSPESQPWYLDAVRKSMEADVNATNRSNIPRASGGGSSGGSNKGSDGSPSTTGNYNMNEVKNKMIEELEKNEVTRDQAIRQVQNRYKAGLIAYEQANDLLRIIDAVAPGAAEPQVNTNASVNVPQANPGMYDWLRF